MDLVDERITKFLSWASMAPEDYEKGNRMLRELQLLLNFGTIYPFGSFLTGLADPRFSDVDVYFKDREGRPKQIVMDHVARRINSVLGWQIINVLPNIRIPIVTFVHLSTQVKCDISFETIMSVQNSKLIRFLISLDPVVFPLITIIRNWARRHQLIHSRNGFKNYSIVLLVIVFLVRRKVLPSIELLQSLVPPIVVDTFWNVNFCDDFAKVTNIMKANNLGSNDKNNNNTFGRPSDIVPFVLDFFDMMLNISRHVVVCTLTGEFLTREIFTCGYEAELPPSQARFLMYKSAFKSLRFTRFPSKRELCLQDPFDLGYNVTRTTNDGFFDRFIQASQETMNQLKSVSANDQQELSIQLGKYLFNPKPVKKVKKSKKIHILSSDSPLPDESLHKV